MPPLTAFGFSVFLLFPGLSSKLAHNGEAAWRRRGEHYRLLEPQTVKFPTKGY